MNDNEGIVKQMMFALSIIILLSGCSSSESQIATAIAQTEAASPTETPIPTNTLVPTATYTLTITPSLTPTSTNTPSPTPDTRVLDVNPEDLILERKELPEEGKFYLYDSTPHRNYEVVSVRGQEDGSKYLQETGRVDAWIKTYVRGTVAARAPVYLSFYPVLYKTASGTEYVMSEDEHPCTVNENFKATLLRELDFGDESYLCQYKEMQSSGKYFIEYYIPIAYRNVFFQIFAGGDIDTFDEEWVVNLVEKQVGKLDSIPLTNEVTWTP